MQNQNSYLRWNEALGKHFFNPHNAGKPIYLHADRLLIERIGSDVLRYEPHEVWQKFMIALKQGFSPTKPNDLLHKAFEAAAQPKLWQHNKQTPAIDGQKVAYPPYLAYLVAFVLPITEEGGLSLRHKDAYHPRLKSFLEKNRLGDDIRLNEKENWNQLWQSLADWSVLDKQGEWGIFKNPEYKNAHWKYVGKPITQCLVPPKTLKRTRQIFNDLQLTPQEQLSVDEWRDLFTQASNTLIDNDLKQLIANPDDELGKAALDQISTEFNYWSGEIKPILTTENAEIPPSVKHGQIVRIHSFLKVLSNLNKLKFEYRLHTDLDYPEDLTFNEKVCEESTNGWSYPLSLDNQWFEQLTLTDDRNNWEARRRQKDVVFYLPADRYNLSGGNTWVEVDTAELFVGATVLVWVRNVNIEQKASWRKGCEKLEEVLANNAPADRHLYKLHYLNNQFSGLKRTQKLDISQIILRGGLALGYRHFAAAILPEVSVSNALGTEMVYLQRANNSRILLERKPNFGTIWLLPTETPRQEPFKIVVNEFESFSFELVDFESFKPQNSIDLPKRDVFGNCIFLKNYANTEGGETPYLAEGINSSVIDKKLHSAYGSYFLSTQQATNDLFFFPPKIKDTPADQLLYWLTHQQIVTIRQFHDAFETVQNAFNSVEETPEKPNLTWQKRRALNFYEALALIDIDLEHDKIRVLPSQLVPIPTDVGMQFVLVGGRTPALMRQLQAECTRLKLPLSIEAQNDPAFLVPPRILVRASAAQMPQVRELAHNCSLRFEINPATNYPQLPQMNLLGMVGHLNELLDKLPLVQGFNPEAYLACQIFNAQRCHFETVASPDFDKTYQLALYKLSEYTFKSVLWRDGQAYDMDKNWGRLAMLNHAQYAVFYFDSDKTHHSNGLRQRSDLAQLAVPTSVPLPRYFMQAFALCSGFAPTIKQLTINDLETSWFVFENIPKLLIDHQVSKKLGQQLVETPITQYDYA